MGSRLLDYHYVRLGRCCCRCCCCCCGKPRRLSSMSRGACCWSFVGSSWMVKPWSWPGTVPAGTEIVLCCCVWSGWSGMFMPNSLMMPEREKGASEEVLVIPASWSEFIVSVGS